MTSSKSNLKGIAEDYAALVEKIKELSEHKEVLRKELAKALANEGPTQLGDYIFEVYLTPGRKTLDKDLLAAEFGDLEPFYKIGKPFATVKYKKAVEDREE